MFRGAAAVSDQLSVISYQFFRACWPLEDGYQGWGYFRGRGNPWLIVETRIVRCFSTAHLRRFHYGQPWFAGLHFAFSFSYCLAFLPGGGFGNVFAQAPDKRISVSRKAREGNRPYSWDDLS